MVFVWIILYVCLAICMSIWEAKYKYTYINNGEWTDYIMYYLLCSWCVIPFNILVWSCDLTVKLVVKLIRVVRRLVEH